MRYINRVLLLLFISLPVAAGFEKPTSDNKSYKPLQLDNGLSVLLISDPDAETTGAAVNIGIGMSDDPKEYPGLAHLLEHMMFAGSAKFPEKGGFMNFMSTRSGGFNFGGFTAPDQTTVMFQVPSGAFDEALARFSDFLEAPKLAIEDIEQEVQIVDHEFTGRADNQAYQEASVYRRALSPSHPYATSFAGNQQSLSHGKPDALKAALTDMFNKGYAARNMTLVVLGAKPLHELEEKVRLDFSALPEGEKLTKNRFPALELAQEGPLWVTVSGKGGEPRLTLRFPFEASLEPHGVDAFTYFSRLLASNQEDGLKTHLVNAGLVTDLGVQPGYLSERDATLDIVMPLTDAGRNQTGRIIGAAMGYIKAVQKSGVSKKRYEAIRSLKRGQFDNLDQPSVMQYVSSLARAMQVFPTEFALSGSFLLGDFEREPLQTFANKLDEDQLVVVRYQPDEKLPEHDPYSNARYSIESVSAERRNRWQAEIEKRSFRIDDHHGNAYLTDNTERFKRTDVHPVPVLLPEWQNEKGFSVWFKQEDLFNSYRGSVFVAIDSPAAFHNESSQVLKQLYAVVLNDVLSDLHEKASEADLQLNVGASPEGIVLRVYGPTARQGRLLSDVVQTIRNAHFTDHHLLYGQKAFERSADQFRNNAPSQRLLLSLFSELNPAFSDPETQLAASKPVSTKALQAFHRQVWEDPQVTMMIHGNMNEKAATELSAHLHKSLGGQFSELEYGLAPVGSLPKGRSVVFDADIPSGSAVMYARQAMKPDSVAMQVMTAQLLNDHMFQAVRSNQALGYKVYATMASDYRHEGVVVGLEAPGMSAVNTRAFVEKEVKMFLKGLSDLSEVEFQRRKDGIRSFLRSSKEQLPARGAYWWSMLMQYNKALDVAALAESDLDQLTARQFSDYATSLLSGDEGRVFLRLSGNPDTL